VREHHTEALQALANGDEARAAALLDEMERLNVRCNQALRIWLKPVLDKLNDHPG
jgi:DNA-binding GntR family transcriptional regulator